MSAVLGMEAAKQAAWTTGQWLAHFRGNAGLRRPIPWDAGPQATPEELSAIGRSLQGWQRGESSDGSHLRAAAHRHAARTNDPAFREVAELFIREEQRHSALMGEWLDRAGLGRIESDWGDRVFRRLRHGARDLEGWGAPVIVVEVLALPYFDAIRAATRSPSLRAVCTQVLADEAAHIRFQCERFASLWRGRSWLSRRLSLLKQEALFLAGVASVWLCHGRALRAGGYSWGRFWTASWRAMRRAWKRMDPARYDWSGQDAG